MDARLQQLLEALQTKKQQQPIQPMQGVGAVPLGGFNAPQGTSSAIPLGGVRPAPVQVLGDIVAPPSDPTALSLPSGGNTDYYPNGIRRQPMDERLPDGTVMGGGLDDAVPMNPFYNAQYDTRGGQPRGLEPRPRLPIQPQDQDFQKLPYDPQNDPSVLQKLPYDPQNDPSVLSPMAKIMGGLTTTEGQTSTETIPRPYPQVPGHPIAMTPNAPISPNGLPQIPEGRPAQRPVTVPTREPDTVVPPKPPSEQEWVENELERIRQAPPEKQNKWMEALIIGLQATQRIADPTNQAGSYQSGAPIQTLGQMKKAEAIQKLEGRLKPIYEKNKREQERQIGGLKIEDIKSEIEARKATTGKTQAETEALKNKKPPQTIKIKRADGTEVEMDAKDVVEHDWRMKEAQVKAEADQMKAELEDERNKNKYDADQKNERSGKIDAWQSKVTDLYAESRSQTANAIRLRGLAQDARNKGGETEALKYEADAIASETAADKAIIKARYEENHPPKETTSYEVPKRKKVKNANDPRGYFN